MPDGSADAIDHARDARGIRFESMNERASLFEGPGLAFVQWYVRGKFLAVAEHDLIGCMQVVSQPLQNAFGQSGTSQLVPFIHEHKLGQIDKALVDFLMELMARSRSRSSAHRSPVSPMRGPSILAKPCAS